MDLALAFVSGLASSAAGIVAYKIFNRPTHERLTHSVAQRYLELRRSCLSRDQAVERIRAEVEAVLANTQDG